MPRSPDDFKLEMRAGPSGSHALKTVKASKVPQTREEKTYHRLKKKIEVLRTEIADWQREIPVYMEKYNQEYLPLVEAHQTLLRKMVFLLDANYAEKRITKSERSKLKNLICEIAANLLEDADEDDVALMDLYKRYNGKDFHEEAAEELRFIAEDVFGMEIDGDADLSPEALDRLLEEKAGEYREQQEREAQAKAARAEKRKKSAKQLEKEKLAQQNENDIAKVIREVFRKLASALHPDREPDDLERQRKTDLMQRVNNAYASKDLLTLLTLQLEIEQIDELSLGNMPVNRLQHINKILQEQMEELEAELVNLSGRFKFEFNMMPWEPLSPKRLVRSLKDDVVGIKGSIRSLEQDLAVFNDFGTLKVWLKHLRF